MAEVLHQLVGELQQDKRKKEWKTILSKDNQRMITFCARCAVSPLRRNDGHGVGDGRVPSLDIPNQSAPDSHWFSRRSGPVAADDHGSGGTVFGHHHLEQNSEGFSIGAYVSALTTVSRAHWGDSVICSLRMGGEDLCAEREAPRPSGSCRILSFERALAPSCSCFCGHRESMSQSCGGNRSVADQLDSRRRFWLQSTASAASRLKRSLRSFGPDERPSVILLSREENPIQPLQLRPSVWGVSGTACSL